MASNSNFPRDICVPRIEYSMRQKTLVGCRQKAKAKRYQERRVDWLAVKCDTKSMNLIKIMFSLLILWQSCDGGWIYSTDYNADFAGYKSGKRQYKAIWIRFLVLVVYERRRYKCNAFFYHLWPCSWIDRKRNQKSHRLFSLEFSYIICFVKNCMFVYVGYFRNDRTRWECIYW